MLATIFKGGDIDIRKIKTVIVFCQFSVLEAVDIAYRYTGINVSALRGAGVGLAARQSYGVSNIIFVPGSGSAGGGFPRFAFKILYLTHIL